jgi:hypothetical protein
VRSLVTVVATVHSLSIGRALLYAVTHDQQTSRAHDRRLIAFLKPVAVNKWQLCPAFA